MGVRKMEQDPSRWVSRRLEPGAEGEEERRTATFIGHGADFDGALRLRESFRIDGEFRGSIESGSTVIVGEAAGIEADVRGRDVIVAGAVVGNVVATRQLTIRGSGRIHGDVETPSLVVERGAVFNGTTKMVRPEVAARAARVSEAAPQPSAIAVVPE
jgi:cytoskeletal protein CcmA (bactofilin family)